MASDDATDDRDALDALELEAKEFDKVGTSPRPPVLLRTFIADPLHDRMPR